jgi:DNA-binding transcriptional ArsR family regulator
MRDPRPFLQELALELTAFWANTTAPLWQRALVVLESEVAFRAREMATRGVGAMLNGLHPAVRYDRGTLSVEHAWSIQCDAAGRGVMLQPSVFAWPRVFVAAIDPWRPTLTYPARGVLQLWGSVEPPDRALQGLLGKQRANVLAAVQVPRTTLEVSIRLRITPSAVSLHLTRLFDSGVVSRTRTGRYVYYHINDRGRAIVEATATIDDRSNPDADGEVACCSRDDIANG